MCTKNVPSKEQIRASGESGGKSRSQHSQPGRISSILVSFRKNAGLIACERSLSLSSETFSPPSTLFLSEDFRPRPVDRREARRKRFAVNRKSHQAFLILRFGCDRMVTSLLGRLAQRLPT